MATIYFRLRDGKKREFDVRKRVKRGGNQEKVRIFNVLIIKNKLYNDSRQ